MADAGAGHVVDQDPFDALALQGLQTCQDRLRTRGAACGGGHGFGGQIGIAGVDDHENVVDAGMGGKGIKRPVGHAAPGNGLPLFGQGPACAGATAGSNDEGGGAHGWSPFPMNRALWREEQLPRSGRGCRYLHKKCANGLICIGNRRCIHCSCEGNRLRMRQRTRFRHMPLSIAEKSLSSPVLLAPLAGITDLPFRTLVSRFGAGLVVSEMVASQEMVQAKPGVRERAELGAHVENTSVQLAGREAHWMARAAKEVEGMGARVIDINMGCPAKKVVGGLSGSALMRDLDHALHLIESVVAAVNIPVTLKTRL